MSLPFSLKAHPDNDCVVVNDKIGFSPDSSYALACYFAGSEGENIARGERFNMTEAAKELGAVLVEIKYFVGCANGMHWKNVQSTVFQRNGYRLHIWSRPKKLGWNLLKMKPKQKKRKCLSASNAQPSEDQIIFSKCDHETCLNDC